MFLGENVVSFVVRRDAHYAPRTVTCQNVVAYPDGYFFAVDGIDCICAGKCAGFFFVCRQAFDFRRFGCLFTVRLYRFTAVGSGDFVHQREFRSENDVRYAEESVGAGGKDSESFVRAVDGKLYFAAGRFTYPVALHRLCFFRPVQFVKSRQQFLRVVGYFKKPLSEIFTYHGGAASFATTLVYLFVGKYGVATRTPVDGCGFAVSEAVFVEL